MKQSAPRWSFLIAAGGSGSRLGGVPKQFRRLGGRAVWRWSFDLADSLRDKGKIADIVLVVPSGMEEEIAAEAEGKELIVVPGGLTRAGSVINGLKKCSGSHVLVHDGARPFISEDLCLRLMEAAEREKVGAIPLLPSADSLKRITGAKMECADRSIYFRTQTPQAFRKDELAAALAEKGEGGTDEASVWLAAGRPIVSVEGEEKNFKITTQFDWEMACALTGKDIEKRTGHGYDIHQLAEGRPLIIAGVEVAGEGFGLLGHSDADLVTHTVMDALLGAAGEPDIGTLFPASDEKWRGANSVALLHSVLEMLASKGWRVEWVDVTLNAQRPRLGHLVPLFIENMNRELGAKGKKLFNMKVKSAEQCGSAGRGECMICHGVATISRFTAQGGRC
ncbi:MAG: 2-C-methyl-D-erythritol 2,4-cyclodiphosphate synthase [Synergistaceae bacterium]|nr:2-C-methyl-D-erythritol 2,4-cyclodiphosphate synthase [Synergistaceae bacterium]